MLDSMLEREQRSIEINRLMIKDEEGNSKLILEKDEIIRETNKHFKSISDTELKINDDITREWIDEYEPLAHIDENIYNSITEEIKE